MLKFLYLCLSLTHTHTHTHTFVEVLRSLSHTHTHTHTHLLKFLDLCHTHTLKTRRLLWTSDRPVPEAATYTTHTKHKRRISVFSGIRTRDPNNLAAADLHVRPNDHRYWPPILLFYELISLELLNCIHNYLSRCSG